MRNVENSIALRGFNSLEQYKSVCYHEIGHALMAYILNIGVKSIYIDNGQGETEYNKLDCTSLKQYQIGFMTYSGTVFEQLKKGIENIDPFYNGSAADVQKFMVYVTNGQFDKEAITTFVKSCAYLLKGLLDDYRVEKLVDLLIKKGCATGEEIRKILFKKRLFLFEPPIEKQIRKYKECKFE